MPSPDTINIDISQRGQLDEHLGHQPHHRVQQVAKVADLEETDITTDEMNIASKKVFWEMLEHTRNNIILILCL